MSQRSLEEEERGDELNWELGYKVGFDYGSNA